MTSFNLMKSHCRFRTKTSDMPRACQVHRQLNEAQLIKRRCFKQCAYFIANYLLTMTFAFTIFLLSVSSHEAKIHNESNVSNLRATILDCTYTNVFSTHVFRLRKANFQHTCQPHNHYRIKKVDLTRETL